MDTTQCGQQKSQLHKTGCQHTPGQCYDRLLKAGGHQQGDADQHHIQPHRRKCSGCESSVTVKNTRSKRHQRHKQQVRESEAQHVSRQVEFQRIAPESWCEQQYHGRTGEHTDQYQQTKHARQSTGYAIDQRLDLSLLALCLVLTEYRHESLCKCAFCKQAAHEIGNLEGDEKGIHPRIDTETRKHHVARQP